MSLLDLAADTLDACKRVGGDAFEIYLQRHRHTSVEISDLAVETVEHSEDAGVGIRVLKDGRVGYAYSTNLEPGSLTELAQNAARNAALIGRDEASVLPGTSSGLEDEVPVLDLYDEALLRIPVEDKIDRALTLEKAARAVDSKIKKVRYATYMDGESEVAIANSEGLARAARGTVSSAHLLAVAEDGKSAEMAGSSAFSRKLGGVDPEAVGREAAEKALRLLGARRITTRKAAVVLAPDIAADFLEVLAPSLSAENVQKGTSLLRGKLGSPVASELVGIVDDGTLPDGMRSAPFDGEGVPHRRTSLVEGGILKAYLYDTYTAAKEGVRSTGNALRPGFKSTPRPGPSNLFLLPGKQSREELLATMDEGLLITAVLGIHTANPVTGDFSVGAAGLWLEKGCPAYPVRGIAIAGNLGDLLRRISGVADDLRFFGHVGAPTVKIEELTLSGQ